MAPVYKYLQEKQTGGKCYAFPACLFFLLYGSFYSSSVASREILNTNPIAARDSNNAVPP